MAIKLSFLSWRDGQEACWMRGWVVAHTESSSSTPLSSPLTVPIFTKQGEGHLSPGGSFQQQHWCFLGLFLRAEAGWCEWEARVEGVGGNRLQKL